MRNLIVVFALASLLAGCRRTDVRSFTIDVPQATDKDVPAIVSALKFYGGIEQETISFDASTHKLTLKYDSMQIAKKNIEMAIAAAGWTANGVTPESIGAKKK